jgi:K+-sensing histidine kinase KdpD
VEHPADPRSDAHAEGRGTPAPLPAVGALFSLTVGLLLPLAVAAAWIPVRTRLPNTDVALVLVVAAGAIGALGRRGAVAAAAASAALWFVVFDTVPYDRLAIAKTPDVETTLVLAVVAVIVGELALRTLRHRRALRAESEELTSVRAAAELVASGEELVLVIDAVADQLKQLLRLSTCRFEAPDGPLPAAAVSRDGRVVAGAPVAFDGGSRQVGLDVVVQQQVLGRFVLGIETDSCLGRDRLLAAVTLADQVGAAFLAQAPPPLPPGAPEPTRGLRVVGADEAAGVVAGARGQETAGFSSAADRMIS